MIKKLRWYGIDDGVDTGKSEGQIPTCACSGKAPVISGISQVRVLEPLLFVIYIIDFLDDIDFDSILLATKISHSLKFQDDINELNKNWLDC